MFKQTKNVSTRVLNSRLPSRFAPLVAMFIVAAASLTLFAQTRGTADSEPSLSLEPAAGAAGTVVRFTAPMPPHAMAFVHWDDGNTAYDATVQRDTGRKYRGGNRPLLQLAGNLTVPEGATPGQHTIAINYTDGTRATAKFVVTTTGKRGRRLGQSGTVPTATPTLGVSIPFPTATVTPIVAARTAVASSPTRIPVVSTATTRPAVPTPTVRSIAPPPTSGSRDKFKQPFASTSIWNMPIGSNASYSFAGIHDWSSFGVFLEENIIVNRPNAPLTPIVYNGDGWSGGSRCDAQGGQLFAAPLPSGYVIPGASGGDMPNYAAAILSPDGNSYLQAQPLTHCTSGGPWTALGQDTTVSLYGDGIQGSQGGSHMSSVGGTIRLGEWHARKISHVLKTVLDSSNYSGTYRWPAVSADSCAPGCYGGSNPNVKMGTLLALRPDFNINQLQTVPGKIVAQAFIDYGCYIVDSGWDPAYLPVEQGPDGNAADEFAQEFGFPMRDGNANSAWSRDWRTIMTNTYVIDNNGPTSIGGGGAPRVPLAPPIGN